MLLHFFHCPLGRGVGKESVEGEDREQVGGGDMWREVEIGI